MKTDEVGRPPIVRCGQLVSVEGGGESSGRFGADQGGSCVEELEEGGHHGSSVEQREKGREEGSGAPA
jgi:hypothetical protein